MVSKAGFAVYESFFGYKYAFGKYAQVGWHDWHHTSL